MNNIDNIIAEMEGNGMQTMATIIWSAEDVLSLDDTLTASQVEDVITHIENKHDASIGVNWDTIKQVIDYIKEK
jgi:hypothetical protein